MSTVIIETSAPAGGAGASVSLTARARVLRMQRVPGALARAVAAQHDEPTRPARTEQQIAEGFLAATRPVPAGRFADR